SIGLHHTGECRHLVSEFVTFCVSRNCITLPAFRTSIWRIDGAGSRIALHNLPSHHQPPDVPMISAELLRQARIESVAQSLREDIGDGDITAQLIPAEKLATARVITREDARLAGSAWVEEVFLQVDPSVTLQWQFRDGDDVPANAVIFRMQGPARSLLTAERAALNWLQTLSGVATACANYARRVSHTNVRLLDTRKTLPGLRLAQKYAVTCGDCDNHRLGLWDAFLIKENHIAACGSIGNAVAEAHRIAPGKPVE